MREITLKRSPRHADASWAIKHAPPRCALELVVGAPCARAARLLAEQRWRAAALTVRRRSIAQHPGRPARRATVIPESSSRPRLAPSHSSGFRSPQVVAKGNQPGVTLHRQDLQGETFALVLPSAWDSKAKCWEPSEVH